MQLCEHGIKHHLHNYSLSLSGRTSRQRQQTRRATQAGRRSIASPAPPVCVCLGNPGVRHWRAGPAPAASLSRNRQEKDHPLGAETSYFTLCEVRFHCSTSERPRPMHQVVQEQLRLHRHVTPVAGGNLSHRGTTSSTPHLYSEDNPQVSRRYSAANRTPALGGSSGGR